MLVVTCKHHRGELSSFFGWRPLRQERAKRWERHPLSGNKNKRTVYLSITKYKNNALCMYTMNTKIKRSNSIYCKFSEKKIMNLNCY